MNDILPDRPRALVVYESLFGCTERVARAVAQGLEDEGFDIRVQNVSDAESPWHDDVHLLVVGAPTHAFSLSRPRTRQDAVRQGGRAEAEGIGLREWIAAIDDRSWVRRSAAAFDTRMTAVRRLPKSASTRAAHLLAHRGFHIIARPTGFLVEDTSGPLVAGELDRARAWGCTLAASYAHDHPRPGTAVG